MLNNCNDKKEYARRLRILFSPPEMLNEDGSIHQEYFLPSRHFFTKQSLECITWKSAQDTELIKGVKEFGIGNWSSIILKYLPNWDARELCERCCNLLGLNNIKQLDAYKGWKGDKKAFEQEKEKNLKKTTKPKAQQKASNSENIASKQSTPAEIPTQQKSQSYEPFQMNIENLLNDRDIDVFEGIENAVPDFKTIDFKQTTSYESQVDEHNSDISSVESDDSSDLDYVE